MKYYLIAGEASGDLHGAKDIGLDAGLLGRPADLDGSVFKSHSSFVVFHR